MEPNAKIIGLFVMLICSAVWIGIYLTAGAYFLRHWHRMPQEYGFTMRFLLGIILLEAFAILAFGH